MTFEAWLSQATGRFPTGVQERLAQEYRAHWEESGGGDVVALFGKPGLVRRRLRRSYFTAEEFGFVNGAGEWVFWVGAMLTVVYAVIPASSGSSASALLTNMFVFGSLFGAWAYSRHWNRTRRANLRLGVCCMATVMSPLQYMQWSETIGIVGGAVLMAFFLGLLWYMPREDARLKRTLALEGASA